MPNFTVTGRVLGTDGIPRADVSITVFERQSLTVDAVKTTTTTNSAGILTATWSESITPASPWDLFVRAEDTSTSETVDSPLISDPTSTTLSVDLVLGSGRYVGRSEWERLDERVAPLLGTTQPQDIAADRLEWLARRADVFPVHLGFYVQAHRLAADRTIQARTCYAFLRAGLSGGLAGLLQAGEPAWEAALRNAWARQILPLPGGRSGEDLDDEVTQEIEAMRELVVDAALVIPAGGAVNQRALLDTAGMTAAQQREFTELWVGRTGSVTDFWASVAASGTLGTGNAELLRFTIQAAALVGHHVGALEALQRERLDESIASVADTAAWDSSDWDALLVAHTVTPPDDVPGADATQQRQNYARALARAIEDSHPTAFLRHRIAADEATTSAPPHTEELVGFFDANLEFDITTTNISRWAVDNLSAFSGSTDPALARANLERMQRVYRLTPRIGRYATAKVLLEHGVGSANDVVQQTREEFVREFGPHFGTEHHDATALAGRVWDNASRIHGATVAMVSTFGLAKSGADALPLVGVSDWGFDGSGHGLDGLATILGNLDYCACTQCRSVFSPAAYLADLLHFLARRPAVGGGNALDVLRLRRPDIEHILLDCANTNTPLPHIDLVNELLERVFAEQFDGSSLQTTWAADELRLHPEHLDAEVYAGTVAGLDRQLTELVHPWVLPFSLPTLEARVVLEHLDVPRHELMCLLTDDNALEVVPTSAAIVAEALGMSDIEGTIVAGTFAGNASSDGREFWGYSSGSESDTWVGILRGTDPLEGDVGQLLRRGGYTLDELRELISLTFVDPNHYGGSGIALQWAETCELDDATIANLDATGLDRLHRFTRLQRRTRIAPRMLSLLIDEVGGGTLDDAFLAQLVDMQRIQTRLGLAWDELATFWSTRIDARTYDDGPRALYHRRFLAKGEGAPAGFAPITARGNTLTGEQAEPAAITTDELPTLLAAARLSEADYVHLRESPFASDRFSFANFTALIRTAALARATKLSITELIELRSLTGLDPFASPAATLDWLDALDTVRRSKFEIAELRWLLHHEGEAALTEAEIARTLVELARGLTTIEAEVATLVDPTGEAIRANLVGVVSDLDEAMKIINMTSGLNEADQAAFVDAEFSSFTDTATATGRLVTNGGTITDLVERRTWTLQTFVGQRRRRAWLIDTAAASFSLPATVAEALLFAVPNLSASLGSAFMFAFASESQIAAKLTINSHPIQFRGWLRLFKAAEFARLHRISADELPWYSGHLSGAWLDLVALPLNGSETPASFAAWARLCRALELREVFRPGEVGHRDMADAASVSVALALLADHRGWDVDGLAFIADAIGWTSVSCFSDELALGRLKAIAEAGERIGVALDTLWSWIHGAPTLTKTAAMKAAARSNAGDEQWPAVAKPLRDRLREQQRDALVAAVLAVDPELDTKDQLFEHLLIDVEMSPCMLTTRILQAISAVQMFVHRVLLQLEATQVVFANSAAQDWAWMKNYRVWEANRKVFLYPENWLEPGLRKDKTPQFEQLEAALLQDTLDTEKIDRALLGYLTGVDGVANLEIVAIHGKSRFTPLWLLGRTQSAPRAYFLRRREAGSDWGPWQDVPLQIEGDNVILLERQGRIVLFWLMIHEEARNEGEHQTVKAQRLAIAWAERDDRGWGQIFMSERTPMIDRLDTSGPNKDALILRAWNLDDAVWLVVYRNSEAATVAPLAQFHYDAVSRHVILGGIDFDPTEHSKHLDAVGNLEESGWIGLTPGYKVEGQRFTKVQLNEQPGGGDAKVKYDPNAEPVATPSPSTTFRQGKYSSVLFRRAPNTGYRSLLHQGDLWTLDADKQFLPAVYDDRQRKFLLEPYLGHDNPKLEGEDVSPGVLGAVTLQVYLGCPPPRAPSRFYPSPPRQESQRRKDKVTKTKVWPKVIPGQVPALADLNGIANFQVQNWAGEAELGKAKKAMGQGADLPAGKDKYEAPPDVFRIRMQALYHPGARWMLEQVALHGVAALYRPNPSSDLFRQRWRHAPLTSSGLDLNDAIVSGPAPIECFDFDFASPYGLYNWEVFYHAPMMIAAKLSADQRWDEAQRWYHMIFDPIETVDLVGETAVSKFWRIKPFVEQAQQLAKDQLQTMLGIDATPAEQETAILEFERQISQWRKHPFDPHAIARVRPGVYQRALLRAYFDNLIAWADHLFAQDTIESINEATILYVLVSQLLGPKPQEVPGPEGTSKTYAELAAEGLDEFSNAAQNLENWILVPTEPAKTLGCSAGEDDLPAWVRERVELRFWYFCYPPNPELLKYWDIIADRLWKIRHCQNIEGNTRTLPLFQPPIDPGLLVRATAAGIDLASVLAELDSGLPPYRFRSVLARADAFCGDLRNLGGALLAAIEKRDGEALARLRGEQEIAMLAVVRDVRVRQVTEAREGLASLRVARKGVDHRRDYYERLQRGGGLIAEEQQQFDMLEWARRFQGVVQSHHALAGFLSLVPQFIASPLPGFEFGGVQLAGMAHGMAAGFDSIGGEFTYQANKAATNAQFTRRKDEWIFQGQQAHLDLQRIDRDIVVAEIRLEIAKRELANHDVQVEHAKSVDRFMRDKFSNREVYDWMIAQLSTLYFQTYQLAFDLAKRAERAYRHELAIPESAPIIKYGYWDSLRKGLLAGDKLAHDLKRLDLAYMDRDVREYELKKNISLAMLDPVALRTLQETGTCVFKLPGLIFDLDHPGHYLRRIRSVSLTIPAVVGPYVSLGARLCLTKHEVSRTPGGALETAYCGTDKIATSTAVSDAGLFNLDFRDERYLPFEYAGAVSEWKLDLPKEVRQFDYRTIGDVVVSIAYTARDGGDTFRGNVEAALRTRFEEVYTNGAAQLFVVHRAFPNEWARFLAPAEDATQQVLSLPVTAQHFPYFAQREGLEVRSVEFVLLLADSVTAMSMTLDFSTGGLPIELGLAKSNAGPFATGSTGVLTPAVPPGTWTLTRAKGISPSEVVADDWLDPTKVSGLLMVVHYGLES